MIEILVLLTAGFGAGIVTGLVGASAVVIVTPFLVIFLGYEPYSAIGISLATDVVASSVSAYTYKKHGNINIKGGLLIAISAVSSAILGSWLSGGMNSAALGGLTGVMILLMGISFRRKTIKQRVEEFKGKVDLRFFREREKFASVLFGTLIGLMTGVFGAGGGVMILMVLTFVLDYKNRRGDANITDLKVVTYDEGGNVETDANVTPAVIQPSIRERVTADQIVSDPVKKVRVFSEQCSEHEIMIQKEEGEWKHASDFKF